MKHKLLSILIVIFILSLTSCIDYVQTISYSNGKYHCYYKVTMSRVLMALADKDADYFSSDLQDSINDEFPDIIFANPIDTEFEAGFEISFDINPKTASEEEKIFLPKKSGTEYFIPFMLGYDFTDTEDLNETDYESEAIAKAIMSTAKFRVMISKDIISSINKAYLDGIEEDDSFVISVFDYGNNFCLEIPVDVLVEARYKLDRIVIN